MAETHRRVEPRGLVGTGMMNDPDRLRDIEQRAERFARDRALPKRKFGEVIAGAPNTAPEGTELEDAPQPERRRKDQKDQKDEKDQQQKQQAAPPAATFERRPPGGSVGVVRGSAPKPKGTDARPAVAAKPASAKPVPADVKPDEKPADKKEDKKEPVRPMTTGSRTPEQSKQAGGHTQVTLKI